MGSLLLAPTWEAHQQDQGCVILNHSPEDKPKTALHKLQGKWPFVSMWSWSDLEIYERRPRKFLTNSQACKYVGRKTEAWACISGMTSAWRQNVTASQREQGDKLLFRNQAEKRLKCRKGFNRPPRGITQLHWNHCILNMPHLAPLKSAACNPAWCLKWLAFVSFWSCYGGLGHWQDKMMDVGPWQKQPDMVRKLKVPNPLSDLDRSPLFQVTGLDSMSCQPW